MMTVAMVTFLFTFSFLPNQMRTVAKYQQKAFCGGFSEDGTVFLSACQGKSFWILKGQLHNELNSGPLVSRVFSA